jgi:hypothetical protein
LNGAVETKKTAPEGAVFILPLPSHAAKFQLQAFA